MSAPAHYTSLEDAAKALARHTGRSVARAGYDLERWLEEGSPPSPGATQIRIRRRREGVEVAYHLGDEGEVTGVSLRLGAAGPGREARRRSQARSRERQDDRAAWDDRPSIAVAVPKALRDRLSARARDSRRSLASELLVACDAAVGSPLGDGEWGPSGDAWISARVDAADLERYQDAAQREGLGLRTWMRRAIERAVG